MSHDPEVVCVKDPPMPNPRFAAFKEVNGNIVYFMFVEQKTLCSVSSFTKCLVLWFAIHYIFHLGYSHKIIKSMTLHFLFKSLFLVCHNVREVNGKLPHT